MSELPQLINLKEVMAITGIARSTIYKKMDEGTFPKGLKVSDACVRWRQSDIKEWIDNLPSN